MGEIYIIYIYKKLATDDLVEEKAGKKGQSREVQRVNPGGFKIQVKEETC